MTAMFPEAHIREVTRAIINSRDFCGNEQEAAWDCAADLGYSIANRKLIYKIANFRANAEWNAHKKAAGVNPKYCF